MSFAKRVGFATDRDDLARTLHGARTRTAWNATMRGARHCALSTVRLARNGEVNRGIEIQRRGSDMVWAAVVANPACRLQTLRTALRDRDACWVL
jgi:hypothetical protein